MHQSQLQRYRYALSDARWRRLFMALAMVVLMVQTGFPAHQDSHPIGDQDSLCQYCVLAGHVFGVPGVAMPPATVPVFAEYQLPSPVEIHVSIFPRTRFSRAPPIPSVA
ncbi:MAG: DUF2946 family protein [Gammaproteobacteria bacterium]